MNQDKDEIGLFEDKNEEIKKEEEENAWEDEDDQNKVKIATSKRYEDIWKRKEVEEELDENDKTLLKTEVKREKKGKKINELNFELLRNATMLRKSKGIITGTQFYDKTPILMTSGRDQFLHLFAMKKDKCFPIGDRLLDQPIELAKFVDESVLMTFNKPKVSLYDMNSHKIKNIPKLDGYDEIDLNYFTVGSQYISFINDGNLSSILVDKKSFQVIDELKGARQILGSVFHPTEDVYLTSGNYGTINIWDLKKMRCRSLVYDEGAINVTSLAISNNGEYIACGSDGGIVNLYEWKSFEKDSHPKPLHTFKNLVNDCNHLVFRNGLLLMSSSKGDKQIRIANVQQRVVYSNFPGFSKFGRIQEIDLSPNARYMAFGNSTGNVSLVKLTDMPGY
ncbi:hypothetical protein ENUP19_0371G0001 [Entamoeba nuttalli]|uniref:WD domain, G-beta repeat-containing protein n=2 Tax=Entamoeba nuttalli TaxID=412467 RepID=K2I0G4_ENTNP|nr:WD domain, G-beta repeat-containing protein [Entamoeba nuttalli P19]EKE42240.1 WD domain, G-beta repeat-containing protein [Entamoeba nuttalli P19]|eukprot:XP_008855425.1 WD domain, G-beta repeat-containing protein [Entamoeba nuttalli P19]